MFKPITMLSKSDFKQLYHKYRKDVINRFKELFRMSLKEKVRNYAQSGIDQSKPVKIFFNALEGILPSDLEDPHVELVNMCVWHINIDVLVKEGKLPKEIKVLLNCWTKYLHQQIFTPQLSVEHYKVLDRVCIPPYPEMETILKQIVITGLPNLYSINRESQEWWEKFMYLYGATYNWFERIAKLIGKFHGEKTGGIANVFQTTKNYEEHGSRVPTIIIKNFLNECRHIKNAIVSHINYKMINTDSIKIWDCNPRGQENFRKEYQRTDLYNILYILLVFIPLIESTVACNQYMVKIRSTIIQYYQKRLVCSYCGHIDNYEVTPNKKRIKCKNTKCRRLIELK